MNNLYTAATIQKKYGITLDQLPNLDINEINRQSPNLIPNRDVMRDIINILQQKQNRKTLINETEWTKTKKVPVHKTTCDQKGIKGFSLIIEIELDIFKNLMNNFSDKIEPTVNENKNAEVDDVKEQQPYKTIQLIPIIQVNKTPIHVQYLWIVSLELKNIKFYIGISLELQNDKLKVTGIFLSLDAYQLIPPVCKTHANLHLFLKNHIPVNKLTIIGKGHEDIIKEKELEIGALRNLLILCCKNPVASPYVLSCLSKN